MLAAVVLSCLQAVVLASPIVRRHQPQSKSKGFTLVVKVTEPTTDFEPSIDQYYVSSIHVGPGQALGGVDPQSARIWYQNGTASDIGQGKGTIVWDSGEPAFPHGFKLAEAEDQVSPVRVDIGHGTTGIQIASPWDSSYPHLTVPGGTGSYIVCNETVRYYGERKFLVLKYAAADVPKGCAKIRLVPQCAELPGEGSLSRQDFAQEVQCYDDVAKSGEIGKEDER
ncbi:hypothetical protein ACRALDRAFT_1062283 [Sodiomyces alcalophilus JCM 7366]|uniref:uncharacterized protein n=1 Tax=Sodiomyces alcalophilus JCM 7366 TaxID=591952 RepID=UPI0039B4BD26